MPDPIKPPNDPKPITESLRRHFDEEAAAIPQGKRGQANVGITTEGVGVGASARYKWATAAGWAGRTWRGEGWSAGARVGVVW